MLKMITSRKFILSLFFLFAAVMVYGQEATMIDSLKKAYANATTAAEKVELVDKLSRVMMNVNPVAAEEYGKELIKVAEESRDRELMFRAYLSNGDRCSFFAAQKSYTDKSIRFYQTALELARQNRMEKNVGKAQLHLSGLYLKLPDYDKALACATQAFSLISTLNDDSLRAEAHNTYGQVYLAKNENILALRNFLNALRIAEDLKNRALIRNCYLNLATFYSGIEDYDRAIDYMTKVYNLLDQIDEKNVPYQKVLYTNSIGSLFAMKKNYDLAISYFERSISMADSLKFSSLKIPGYVSLLNQYLQLKEPRKALAYMNSIEGDNLKRFLANAGMAAITDEAYGVIYTDIGKYDSAKFFLERAKPVLEKNSNENTTIHFYYELANYYRKSGDKKNAINYYLKVKEISEKNGILENVIEASKQLDTLYANTGNLGLAGKYKSVYYQYKDSTEKLKREKELTQVEADDEQRRQEKMQIEAAEAKKRRNNIQYLGIVIGIISLFVTLVILGMFKISAGLIRGLGFFVFIMFFEFIFLIFKKNIYTLTHGEPWKDLGFMIALAAILVPLHHWLEHRVLGYLTSHNRLTAAGHHLKKKVFGRTKTGKD